MARDVEIDAAIQSYYEASAEGQRLALGASQLEAQRTRDLITRHAPGPPARVIDVGGAAGAYAVWLATSGYAVQLIDPVPKHVDEARRFAESCGVHVGCVVGDARKLELPDAEADVVLMLGPLYHLVDEHDRSLALREASRVLKPGGMLFAAAISRWASALDGLSRDLFADERFRTIVDRDLREGQHRNETERVDYFTTAYFHRPEELRDELSRAGLVVDAVHGLEGPGWLFPDFDERWADPRRRGDLVRVAEMLSTEPGIVGVSAHLLAIARTPSRE
jgi:ubiquinone/menaquinone biosynthesis C-methylase UbiE